MTTHSKAFLRAMIREKRRHLSPEDIQTQSQRICQQTIEMDIFQNAKHVAAYLPFDGEVDPSLIIQTAWQLNKHCYLPTLDPASQRQLRFMPYEMETPLTANRYGISEPAFDTEKCFAAEKLDLVLLPLVAFDKQGNRLGMGAGFYDMTFAFLNPINHINRQTKPQHQPALVGLAFDFQHLDTLPTENWDIPLSAIVTESRVYPSKNKP